MAEVINWARIKLEYIIGEVSLAELARKNGITAAAVSKQSRLNDWVQERAQYRETVAAKAHARTEQKAIDDTVKLYESTRTAADQLIAQILAYTADPQALFRHVVPVDQSYYDKDKKSTVFNRTQSGVVLDTINGKAAADLARALKDLLPVARTIDGRIDAAAAAKLDIERDKLELDKRRAGMSDDLEQESGIALMPAVDESLLDDALPDPDQPEPAADSDGDPA